MIIKFGVLEKKLAKILDCYKGKFAIKSFNPLSVYWFKKYRPDFIRGQLSQGFSNDNILKKIFLKNMYFNFITKPDFISYDINALPNNNVQKYRDKGHVVLGWTVNDKKKFEKGKKYCDNLICENFDIITK